MKIEKFVRKELKRILQNRQNSLRKTLKRRNLYIPRAANFENSMIQSFLSKLILQAKEDKEVLAVALFGSSARGELYKDVDLCIFLRNRISNLDMTKKRLKFLSFLNNDKFDIQIFQQLPLYIRMRILKEGKILLVKNEPALYKIAFEAIKEFESYKKGYYMYLEQIKNGPRKNFIKI